MISRHWKGVAKPGDAAAYIHLLKTETFPHLASIPGFVRASILSRAVEAGTEFQIVTVWESLDAIQAFAGARVDAITRGGPGRDAGGVDDRRRA
jgi:heme-degrading monooxygenase HmoA